MTKTEFLLLVKYINGSASTKCRFTYSEMIRSERLHDTKLINWYFLISRN